jgi:glycine hydroxymethyltransferase
MKGGLDIVTGGTDTHLMLVDLRPKGVKGNATEKALGRAHITCNKNGIPFDPEKPTITSGVRLGSPAGTTRGFGEAEFRQIGDWIVEVVDGLAANGEDGNGASRPRSRPKSLSSAGNSRSIPTSDAGAARGWPGRWTAADPGMGSVEILRRCLSPF